MCDARGSIFQAGTFYLERMGAGLGNIRFLRSHSLGLWGRFERVIPRNDGRGRYCTNHRFRRPIRLLWSSSGPPLLCESGKGCDAWDDVRGRRKRGGRGRDGIGTRSRLAPHYFETLSQIGVEDFFFPVSLSLALCMAARRPIRWE